MAAPDDRAPDLDELPAAYAWALTLRRVGVPDDELARRLGIPVEGLDALLRIAHAKLETIRLHEPGADHRQPDG